MTEDLKRACSVSDCQRKVFCRGWCEPHYRRWLRNGDPKAGQTRRWSAINWVKDIALVYEGDDCLIWPFSRDKDGYARITLPERKRGVHQIVCEERCGAKPSDEYEVAHLCGKGHEGCVNYRHLAWKTKKENAADRIKHGTSNRGEKSVWAKLTEEDVREIRRMKGKMRQREIASKFNVKPLAISRIWRGISWGWLDKEIDQ